MKPSHTFEIETPNGNIVMEVGQVARQANGAVMVRYGDTAVLVAATGTTSARPGQSFFPLTCDYREMAYSAGKIPGGFFKRKGRPSTKETIGCRLMDRPIRPLFPEGYKNEVQIQAMVLSYEGDHPPEFMSILGASAALTISDIPFLGPIGAVRVGYIDGEIRINPTVAEMDRSLLDLTVAGSKKGLCMVEAGAKGVKEEIIIEAFQKAHEAIIVQCEVQDKMREALGKPKMDFVPMTYTPELFAEVEKLATPGVEEACQATNKKKQYSRIDQIADELKAHFADRVASGEVDFMFVKEALEDVVKKRVRKLILEEGRRPDGRESTTIRDVTCVPSMLPRVHGSALFTRGETQALATLTLGVSRDEQVIDGLEEYRERFILHYNFPPFSVGECRFLRGPGRREIGHGELARRALAPVIPPKEKFPYTVRIVSETLESNGSSSQAAICGGCLAMMDGGVPIAYPVAGIAMGLVAEGDKVAILTDIAGWEDHYGDMDFKVAGGREGITALQMDIKVENLEVETLTRALEQARQARFQLLDTMAQTLAEPRENLSSHAPRVISIPINPDKIGAIIGPGGKTIRHIQEVSGAEIDIDDMSNRVNVYSVDEESGAKAEAMVRALIEEPEVGKIYNGKVVRVTKFGAFVEIIPHQDGLVHISQMEEHRVERVEDICQVGDLMPVKITGIDEMGRINLSRKDAIRELNGEPPRPPDEREDRDERPPRRDRDDRPPRRDRDDRPPRRDRDDRPPRRDRDDRGGRDRDRGGRDRDRDRGGRDRDRGGRDRDRGGRDRDRGGRDHHDRGRDNHDRAGRDHDRAPRPESKPENDDE